jgi:two-component system response regulator PilR (NtrC family)
VALPESSQLDAVALSLPVYLESIEKQAIKEALVMTSLNKTAAAKLLGVSFRSLRYRLAKHKC